MSCAVVEPMLTGPRLTGPARSGRPRTTVRDRALPSPRSSVEPAGAPADTVRLRLTRRGRVVVAALAVALGAAGVLGAQVAQADAPAAPTAVSEHVVAPGETLWGIAAATAGPGEDVRDVVDRIAALNGLDGSMLRVGQALVVPQP